MPKRSAWGRDRACLLVAKGDLRAEVAAALTKVGFRVRSAESVAKAELPQDVEPIAIAIVSNALGENAVSTLVAWAKQRHPEVPVAVLGSSDRVDEAVSAVRAGVADFFPSPIRPEVLVARLARLLGSSNPTAIDAPAPEFVGVAGASPAMKSLFAALQKISRYKTNVLLLGESGTGKELIARALHSRGPRRQRLFVPLNCATLGRELLENELFGHERGAFTGAAERKKGLFELADGGTLLLDEIGEMDLSTQAKLLRVLERNEFRRVGGTEKVQVDLSVIAATNRSLESLIAAGRFREDLYYRLKVVTLVVPPLRERKEDIPALIEYFIADFNRRNGQKIKGIAPQTLKRFMEAPWRGNVRELKNAVESAAVMATGETLGLDSIVEDPGARGIVESAVAPYGAAGRDEPSPRGEVRIRPGTSLADVEKIMILATVDLLGNKAAAAEALGIGTRTLFTKLRQYSLPEQKSRT